MGGTLSVAFLVAGAIGLFVGLAMGFGVVPGAQSLAPTNPPVSGYVTAGALAWTSSGTTVHLWENGTYRSQTTLAVTFYVGTSATTVNPSKCGAAACSYSAATTIILSTGSYNAYAIASGTCGAPHCTTTSANSGTITLTITQNGASATPNLQAAFKYSQTPSTMTVSFTDASTGTNGVVVSPSTNTWTTSDGSSATGGSFSHTFSSSGIFWVTEVAHGTSSGQSISNSTTASVSVWPSSCYNCPLTIHAQFRYTFTGLNATLVDYSTVQNGTLGTPKWSFGDGSNGSGSSVIHSYLRAGTYFVSETVSATGLLGTTGTQTYAFNVTVGAGSNQTGCTGSNCGGIAPFILGPLNGALIGGSVGLMALAGVRNPRIMAILVGGGLAFGAAVGFVI